MAAGVGLMAFVARAAVGGGPNRVLQAYNIMECTELDCLWDFKEWLEPHLQPLRGFATSQFGDGMRMRLSSARMLPELFAYTFASRRKPPLGCHRV
eukprot:5201666-Pleurochrysis_carterae.AAC.2